MAGRPRFVRTTSVFQMSSIPPSSFIRRIPDWKSGAELEVGVATGDARIARAWHADVQPLVVQDRRLDANWNWPRLLFLTDLIERLNAREIRYLYLYLGGPDGRVVILGQAICSIGYPALNDASVQSVFVWYLTKSPDGWLRRHGLATGVMVVEGLLDCAITLSLAAGFEGRIGLHAAEHPSDREISAKLLAVYRRTGLTQLSEAAPSPRPLQRNDGRYFYADPAGALAIHQKFDYLR